MVFVSLGRYVNPFEKTMASSWFGQQGFEPIAGLRPRKGWPDLRRELRGFTRCNEEQRVPGLAGVEQMRLCADAGGLWSEADFAGRAGTRRGFIEKESWN